MSMRTIYLLRHAKAVDREKWHGEDIERPLTPKGLKQAQGVAEALASASIKAILSSPALRCRDTVAPLARKTKRVPFEVVSFLAEGSDPLKALHALVNWQNTTQERNGQELTEGESRSLSVVACSHGDVITGMLTELAQSKVITFSQILSAKGSLWILKTKGAEVVEAMYIEEPGSTFGRSAIRSVGI